MDATAYWAEGLRYFQRDLGYAARDRFLRLAEMPGADLARNWNAAGLAAVKLREFREAEGYLLRSLAAAEAAGDLRSVLKARVNLTLLYVRNCQVQPALASAHEAERLFDSVGDPRLRIHGLATVAYAHGLVYDWGVALTHTQEAIRSLEHVPDPEMSAWLYNNLGAYLYELGRLDEATDALQRALEGARAQQNVDVVAHACTDLARLYVKAGDWQAGVRYGREAVDHLWNQMGSADKAEVARLCELFGRLAVAMDERRKGNALLERAGTYYAQLSYWREWGRIRELIQSGGIGRLVRSEDVTPDARATLEWFTDLFGLLDTIEGADAALFQTGQLVTHYALCLGRHLGLDICQQSILAHAGRLCDIGLTTFEPEAIADEEGFRFKMHPELGARWLADFHMPAGTGAVVRAHHERYDGSGYPDGLRGEAIPLAARLLAVCERYVLAMQRGAGHDQAMAALKTEGGSALDPSLVDAFVEMHA